ncbi:U3 small nucleolar RNA-associated protein like [Actinidia chinensis var. chinensis]|uniref:U3 small nucleolar RNA-associated protein like n=1 Tax=Actinidia chinensis var. chinensis TaxID=1590841 RepID=A0A2R6RXR1_ACTCC|nr:U3 small nucleolar RNA-associated protein like [Actinidia chinensis var. chinensis]
MEKNILEESFTFRSESCIGLFSDDELDEEENYIEIPVEPAVLVPDDDDHDETRQEKNTHTDSAADEELHGDPFPISFCSLDEGFSSASPITTSTTTATSNSTECSGDPGTVTPPPPPPSAPQFRASRFLRIGRINNDNTRKAKAQFLVLHHLLSAFLSALKPSTPPSSPMETTHQNGTPDDHNPKLSRNPRRKKSKVKTTMTNGGVMKFLIKFQFRSIITSLFKPQQASASSGSSSSTPTPCNKGFSKESDGSLMIKPLDRWSKQRKQHHTESNSSKMDMNPSVAKEQRSWKVLELNLESLSMFNEGRKGNKQTKSCPNLTKSSPIHGGGGVPSESRIYTRDNSVQAAIAHCKTSLGQTHGG